MYGYGYLRNIFNWALPQAQNLTGAGTNALGTAGSYFNKLLTGNRATLQQATAPESNAVLSQADAAKRQVSSMGTARGGGSAGINRTVDDAAMSRIDNALFGVRPAAAKGLEDVGRTELAGGLQAGSLASTTAGELTDAAIGSRTNSAAINAQAQAQVGSVIEAFMGGFL